ncbi:MAG: GNAT family N-acetyltransferase [Proteobacteria bacterium]|nr:GNAT family N-acetyltransferase [Pseudomonadota bacterium]MBU1741433.1 GNAT family N-acetyltransferase [Pseudomonadota bacterium]
MARAPILADDGLDLTRPVIESWTKARLEGAGQVFTGPATGPARWLVGAGVLAWDSRIFGLTCGRLFPIVHDLLPGRVGASDETAVESVGRRTVARALGWLGGQGVAFVSARVDGRDLIGAHVLEQAGFRLMDVSTIHRLDLAGKIPSVRPPKGFRLRPAEPQDERRLAGLAASAMTDVQYFQDRFTVDPILAPMAKKMYRAWWRNSIRGERADEIWVLEHGGRPVGFITLTGADAAETSLTNHAGGWVVLNGIESDWRGRGLYRLLVLGALRRLKKRGCQSARVKTKLTQRAVQRTWQALGARLTASSLVFHRRL